MLHISSENKRRGSWVFVTAFVCQKCKYFTLWFGRKPKDCPWCELDWMST